MANRNEDNQLKRIVLPSGKTIEVVYFESLTAAPAAPHDAMPSEAPQVEPHKGTERDLHVCPDCSSDLVYPVAWEEADDAFGIRIVPRKA